MSYAVSLSGMNNAAARLDNSAKNVANMFSTSKSDGGDTVKAPYTPTDIISISQEAGGVISVQRERNNATIPVYDPESAVADEDGMVETPNVDLDREVVKQEMVTYDYKANLKALEAQKKMDDALLDIKA